MYYRKRKESINPQLLALKKEEKITKPPTLGRTHFYQLSNFGRAPKTNQVSNFGRAHFNQVSNFGHAPSSIK
jgi:hypothetical protein